MNPANKIAISFAIVAMICVSLMIVNHLAVYSGEPYEITVIKTYLALALDTHNINAKVNYIDNTIDKLAGFEGNSEWWFPTTKSDITETKFLLATVSADVKEQLGVKERDNYFMLPHNELVVYLNTEISDGSSRLSSYQHGLYWNPANNPLLYVLFTLAVSSIPIFLISATIGDDRDYNNRWLAKVEKKALAKKKKAEAQEIDAGNCI